MKKILIIEDDPKIALALEVRFQKNGYETLRAADAVMGANLALSAQPDLVILDISLPDGDGLDLARQFRRQFETKSIPVIFVTASKDPDLRARAMTMGIAGLIEKPYDPEELLSTVRLALATRTAKKSNPAPSSQCSRRILIIEDDPKIAIALAARLKPGGYDTTLAHDALTGVATAVKSRPDLVLLDISMPAGNGFGVAERIRALIPKLTPIIFLTASKEPGLRQKAEHLGAAAFFEKPYDSHALLAAIERALGQ